MNCKNCQAELLENHKFCTECGTKVNKDLGLSEVEVKRMKQELRMERQRQGRNIISKISYNRKHFLTVLSFMKNNSLTLFFVLVFMLIPWKNNYLRVIIFSIYLLSIYFYPLITGKKRFKWDEFLENWINDQNNITNLKNTAKIVANQTKESIKKAKQQIDDQRAKKIEEQANKKKCINAQNNHNTQSEDTQQHHPPLESKEQLNQKVEKQSIMESTKFPIFSFNKELVFGIIAMIIGWIARLCSSSSSFSIQEQLTSVMTNGELSGMGMVYLIGNATIFLAILLMIGGLIKGFSRSHKGGGVLKIISILILIIATGVVIYIYSNPMESLGIAIQGTLESRMSFSEGYETFEIIFSILSMLPWFIGGMYVIGILCNLAHSDNKRGER